MTVEVQAAGSSYINAQVIQNVNNRRRIEEQQGLTQQSDATPRPQKVEHGERSEDRPQPGGAAYQQMYASAKQFVDEAAQASGAAGFGAGAYAEVQNFAARDEMKEMLGVSVYA